MQRPLITSALVWAILAVSAGSAFASDAFDGPSEFSWIPQTRALSRAQVQNELIQAQQAGLVVQHDTVYPNAAPDTRVATASAPLLIGLAGNRQGTRTTYFGSQSQSPRRTRPTRGPRRGARSAHNDAPGDSRAQCDLRSWAASDPCRSGDGLFWRTCAASAASAMPLPDNEEARRSGLLAI